MTFCQAWASSSHFRHPWFNTSISKRKRCETSAGDLDDQIQTTDAKRRRLCSTLEHGFAYLSIEKSSSTSTTTADVPLANGSHFPHPVNFSTMDSDMLSPQPVYAVAEPTRSDVDMKLSSWYEPEHDRIVITDLDLFTESDDEREHEESIDINPLLLDHIRGKELGKDSLCPKATSTALVLFRPLPGLERWQREVTQVKRKDPVDENAMDLEP